MYIENQRKIQAFTLPNYVIKEEKQKQNMLQSNRLIN